MGHAHSLWNSSAILLCMINIYKACIIYIHFTEIADPTVSVHCAPPPVTVTHSAALFKQAMWTDLALVLLEKNWMPRVAVYHVISHFHGTLFSRISRSNWPSRKYILTNILLNHTNIRNQGGLHKIQIVKYPSKRQFANIHPAKIRDHTVHVVAVSKCVSKERPKPTRLDCGVVQSEATALRPLLAAILSTTSQT